jgi:SAM-dependent methyltransferase
VYQQLEGGRGRDVYFRAPRIKAGLLVKGEVPMVRLGELQGRVRDLSSDGLLCDLFGREHLPKLGAIVPIQIQVRDEPLFSATAEVVRAESVRGVARIAVRFLGALLDRNQVRERAQDAVFRGAFDAGLSVYESVPAEYRLAISDAVLILSHWRDLIDGREREIRNGRSGSEFPELAELQEVAARRVRLDWQRVHARASEAAEGARNSAQGIGAAKRLTETLLTPLLIDAPIWRQAYLKPRGYPGDFELMNLMYEETWQGDSVFARVKHQLGREERLAATVRHRKDFLVGQLKAELARHNRQSGDLRVTNIGAGPARELEEFLLKVQLDSRLVVTLIDQDEAALEYAHEKLRRASLHHGDRIELRCRFVSFKQLLGATALTEEVREQDLIYTAGFFDYLPDSVAAPLLARLVGLLREGGRLLVGNAVDATEVKWVPEFVLDWEMIYRTPADMRELAQMIATSCQLDVVFDESGAWQFLSAQRRC